MGCGCRGGGGRRSPVRTVTNPTTNIANAARLRQAQVQNSIKEMNVKISGLSKEQKDAERKRRVQLIMKKRNLNQ